MKRRIKKAGTKLSRKQLDRRRTTWHGRARQHGLTVPGCTVVPPSTARPCHFSGRPVLVALGRMTLDARPCLACFALVALFLVPRASLYLYSSPGSSRNATFSNKTRRFFLKAQKSRTISKTASKEANCLLYTSPSPRD